MTTEQQINTQISRRMVLRGFAAGLTAYLSTGCGFAPETGEAFAPWTFPGDERRPEVLAVAAALLAANPHNSQPWLFRITPEEIELRADLERSLGTMDGLLREMWIGLGCAIENLVIAAVANGREAAVELLPEADDGTLVARIRLSPSEPRDSELYDAIPNRHTNRGPYAESGVAGIEELLRGEMDSKELSLTFHEDEEGKQRVKAGIIDATVALLADEEMSEDSHRWYRHTAEEIDLYRDGTTLDATGNGATLRHFGKITARPSAERAGDYWLANIKQNQLSGAGFVILASRDRNDRRQQLEIGRAYQRMHLRATSVGLAMHPHNQMAERQDREEVRGIEPEFSDRLAELVTPAGFGAQMIFRIGVPWDEALASPRRGLLEVVE